MTFVGKVLVVVQFALSVCFMAFAGAVYTTQTNWRTEAEKASSATASLRTEMTNQQEESQRVLTEKENELVRLKQEKDLVASQAKTASESVQRLQAELTTARTQADQQTAVANLAAEQAQFRQEEAMKQRERNQLLHNQVDDLLAKNRELEDQVFANELTMDSMRTRQSQILTELEQVRAQLAQSTGPSQSGGSPSTYTAADNQPPKVVGRITATQTSPTSRSEFVEISLGSDDGFEKGHELIVYRGGDYLGKVELISVTPDRSVGRVIQRNRNGVIQKGDNVTPQL